MTKDEFLNQTATGGLLTDDRELLMKCFDENGEVNAEAFMDYTLMQLQMQTSVRIQGLNKVISEALREFEFMKQWTNLSQIHRSLPDQIVGAARGTNFEAELKLWAEEMNTFNGLSREERKLALEAVKKKEAENA